MWPYLIGGAAVAYAADKYLWPMLKKKTTAPKTGAPSPSAPQPVSGGITPPGKPQPPGVIIPPVPTAPVVDALHNTAAALVVFLNSHAPDSAAHPEVSAFQNQFNLTSPLTPLQQDGKYGPKSQAALQGIIAPAIAPSNWFPAGNSVPTPANPAPPPVKNVSVSDAATALVNMGTIPAASIAQVTTFQHAYNGSGGTPNLVEDGKYGPMSQAALQSVLNAMGNGQNAPKNPYGAAPTSIPDFSGDLSGTGA